MCFVINAIKFYILQFFFFCIFTIITILCVVNDIELNYDQVYEGSVASKNHITPGASVATLNGTRIESVKEVCCL